MNQQPISVASINALAAMTQWTDPRTQYATSFATFVILTPFAKPQPKYHLSQNSQQLLQLCLLRPYFFLEQAIVEHPHRQLWPKPA